MRREIKLTSGILILILELVLLTSCGGNRVEPLSKSTFPQVKYFTFSSNGVLKKGKVFLPPAYETKKTFQPSF